MSKEKKVLKVDAEDAITLTRAEIDALTKHEKKVRADVASDVSGDIRKRLLEYKKKERDLLNRSKERIEQAKHLYGELMCISLLTDLQMLEELYWEV